MKVKNKEILFIYFFVMAQKFLMNYYLEEVEKVVVLLEVID